MASTFYVHLDGLQAICSLLETERISLSAFAVGVALCRYMDREGNCWPSREILGRRAGISRIDTVRRAIKDLTEHGFIVTRKGQRSNQYQFCSGSAYQTNPRECDIPSSADAQSASADKSCRREKRVGRTIPDDAKSAPTGKNKNPADAVSVGSAGAESASALYIMNESKNESICENKEVSQNSDAEKSRTAKTSTKPKVTRTREGFFIPKCFRDTWFRAYPGVNIDREIAKAFAWCTSNPKRAPKKDFGRFLNSWLSRAKPTHDESLMVTPDDTYEPTPEDLALMLHCEREIAARKAANA